MKWKAFTHFFAAFTWDRAVKWAAAAGGAVLGLLGGWDLPLQILACFMLADYLTGLTLAFLHKSGKTAGGGVSSRAGLAGLLRKGAMAAVVAVATLLDALTGADMMRQSACLFFIANEGISILENAAALGAPLPPFLTAALESLQKGGKNKDV